MVKGTKKKEMISKEDHQLIVSKLSSKLAQKDALLALSLKHNSMELDDLVKTIREVGFEEGYSVENYKNHETPFSDGVIESDDYYEDSKSGDRKSKRSRETDDYDQSCTVKSEKSNKSGASSAVTSWRKGAASKVVWWNPDFSKIELLFAEVYPQLDTILDKYSTIMKDIRLFYVWLYHNSKSLHEIHDVHPLVLKYFKSFFSSVNTQFSSFPYKYDIIKAGGFRLAGQLPVSLRSSAVTTSSSSIISSTLQTVAFQASEEQVRESVSSTEIISSTESREFNGFTDFFVIEGDTSVDDKTAKLENSLFHLEIKKPFGDLFDGSGFMCRDQFLGLTSIIAEMKRNSSGAVNLYMGLLFDFFVGSVGFYVVDCFYFTSRVGSPKKILLLFTLLMHLSKSSFDEIIGFLFGNGEIRRTGVKTNDALDIVDEQKPYRVMVDQRKEIEENSSSLMISIRDGATSDEIEISPSTSKPSNGDKKRGRSTAEDDLAEQTTKAPVVKPSKAMDEDNDEEEQADKAKDKKVKRKRTEENENLQLKRKKDDNDDDNMGRGGEGRREGRGGSGRGRSGRGRSGRGRSGRGGGGGRRKTGLKSGDYVVSVIQAGHSDKENTNPRPSVLATPMVLKPAVIPCKFWDEDSVNSEYYQDSASVSSLGSSFQEDLRCFQEEKEAVNLDHVEISMLSKDALSRLGSRKLVIM
jgi:hypothetical protein